MALSRNSVELKLGGQKIILKTSESDPALVQEVIELVARKLKEAESQGRARVAHEVALVALLDVAGEYVKARRRTAEYQRQVAQETERLITQVERELSPLSESSHPDDLISGDLPREAEPHA